MIFLGLSSASTLLPRSLGFFSWQFCVLKSYLGPHRRRSQHRRQDLRVAEWDDGGLVPGAWLSSRDGAACLIDFFRQVFLALLGVHARCVVLLGLESQQTFSNRGFAPRSPISF
jgi:hypothetical protein